MSDFDRALAFVLARENGLADDPADPGGRTMRGITQRVYDAWRDAQRLPRRDVALIEPPEWTAIYDAEYWRPAGCVALAAPSDLAVFDTAVNMGAGRAKALWGQTRGLDAFLWARLDLYRRIVLAHPAQGKFLPGWVRRLVLLHGACVGGTP